MKKGFCTLKRNQLKHAPWNYKIVKGDKAWSENDQFMHDSLVANLKEHGQVQTIVVRELAKHLEVVDGNHRLDAFEDAKINDVHCFNLGKVTKEQAQRIAVELNETKFQSDDAKLAGLLDGLFKKLDVESLIDTLPFSESEITSFDNFFNEPGEGKDDEPEVVVGKAAGAKGGGSGEFQKITIDVPRKMYQRFYDQVTRFKELHYPNEKPEDIKILDPFYKMVRLLENASDASIKKL